MASMLECHNDTEILINVAKWIDEATIIPVKMVFLVLRVAVPTSLRSFLSLQTEYNTCVSEIILGMDPCQWETTLPCNVVFRWLRQYPEWFQGIMHHYQPLSLYINIYTHVCVYSGY